ncbi:PREDICTED: uncharacterized protein LOC106314876 [Brassica oleracea var. oleracea]|uniref:uncharacterized protein LOC106314876 n=1 Tax=Brassica oleracea var. oleracea TaxID=109376 RepID=UPI0006A6E176|nr:PREDICTED: uncharacterized protein LOC106314876 [Brassica oleracea var. oleracea]
MEKLQKDIEGAGEFVPSKSGAAFSIGHDNHSASGTSGGSNASKRRGTSWKRFKQTPSGARKETQSETIQSSMTTLSWNCRGLRSVLTVRRLEEMCREHLPDFLFLLETKNSSDHIEGFKRSLGYDHSFLVNPVGLSGCLVLFWRNSHEVEILSSSDRIIDARVKQRYLVYFISFVYGDPVRHKRQIVWDNLKTIGLNMNAGWCLVGDFNELMNSSEKSGGPAHEESSFYPFRNMASGCRIKEIPSSGDKFSWVGVREVVNSGVKENVWVQYRLDRTFGNAEWFRLFPRSHTHYLERLGSDHRPILTKIIGAGTKHVGRFMYDKRWSNNPEVEEIVRQSWNTSHNGSINTVSDRIASCRKALSKWKRNEASNSKKMIMRFRVELEEEEKKTSPTMHKIVYLKLELAKLFQEEEEYWKLKSKNNWLQAGDKNTKIFHGWARTRKMKNFITSLTDPGGIEHTSEEAKGEIAIQYFTELFSTSQPTDATELLQDFAPKVTEQMNLKLTKHVTDAEIKRAVKAIKSDSSRGVDGITGHFFQNLRPISLCAVSYKIISNILCARLKGILPFLVSPTQGVFLAERLISDNLLIAHEMIHGLKTNPNCKGDFIAIKTDMSKAYDRVEWSFLEVLFQRMEFAERWIQWIMLCIRSVSYTVLFNGQTYGRITPERGIRQGDPLSPFLFILCAEALVHVMNIAELQGNIT